MTVCFCWLPSLVEAPRGSGCSTWRDVRVAEPSLENPAPRPFDQVHVHVGYLAAVCFGAVF